MVQFGKLITKAATDYAAFVPPDQFLDYEKLKALIERPSSPGAVGDKQKAQFFAAVDTEMKKVRDFISASFARQEDLCSCTAGFAVSLRCIMSRHHPLSDGEAAILNDYTKLNREGFRKILKKWAKNHEKSTTQAEIDLRLQLCSRA